MLNQSPRRRRLPQLSLTQLPRLSSARHHRDQDHGIDILQFQVPENSKEQRNGFRYQRLWRKRASWCLLLLCDYGNLRDSKAPGAATGWQGDMLPVWFGDLPRRRACSSSWAWTRKARSMPSAAPDPARSRRPSKRHTSCAVDGSSTSPESGQVNVQQPNHRSRARLPPGARRRGCGRHDARIRAPRILDRR